MTVEAIKAAIAELPEERQRAGRLAREIEQRAWNQDVEREQQAWDKEIERDFSAGGRYGITGRAGT